MAYNKLSLLDKLLIKTTPSGDCLLWKGQLFKSGYGGLRVGGRVQRAHRLMYEVHHGPIPSGMVVMHTCDEPSCIAISHLKLGTQADNVRDMHDKGRAVYLTGSNNPKSKLSAVQVTEIRQRFVKGSRVNGSRPLAREFGVSHASIQAIVARKVWR